MVNIKDIRNTLTLLRRITKYGVFLLSLMCIIYCGLMYFGYDCFGIHLALFGFALTLRLTLSKIFGFCWVHKACIIYIFLISLCVATLRHNVITIIGLNTKDVELILFVLGLLLIIPIISKLKDNEC